MKRNKQKNINQYNSPRIRFPFDATASINGKRYRATNEEEFRILSRMVAGVSPRPSGREYSFLTRLRALITNNSNMINHIAGEDQKNYERHKESELILKMRRNSRKR